MDGIIDLGSPAANELGFTSDKFDGYLWRMGDEIYISLIRSKQPGQGNFSALIKAIKAAGFRPVVPTPMARMLSILKKWGYISEIREAEHGFSCVVYTERK